MQSCEEPDAVGMDVLPESDRLDLLFSDSATLYTKTVLEDSLRTDEISQQLLGSISDPVFGKHQASVFSQVVLEGVPSFGTVTQADSLILSLLYTGSYGDTTYPQVFNVYRMTENMFFDSAYYSTRSFAYDPAPIGTATVEPKPNTNVVVGSDTVSPRILIKLSQALADSIIALNGQAVLSSNVLWLDYFKGLYIAANPVATGVSGNISYLNFVGSKMTLYYHDTTNTVKNYALSLAAARSTVFTHDYTGTDVGLQLADSSAVDSLSYIQAMSGVKTKISLPFLKHFVDSGSIIINKAELEISVQANTPSDYPPPSQLLLLGIDSLGGYYFPLDYYEVSGYYGGILNSTTRKYKFNIARQVQKILEGSVGNYGFYLVPSGSSIQANRVVTGSAKNSNYRMKFNIYYTKLPR